MYEPGSGEHLTFFLYALPKTGKKPHIRLELLNALVQRGCAHYHSHVIRFYLGYSLLQSGTLPLVLYPSGYAYVVHHRHENQRPSRQGYVGSDSYALCAYRLFQHLHQYFLARLDYILYIWHFLMQLGSFAELEVAAVRQYIPSV